MNSAGTFGLAAGKAYISVNATGTAKTTMSGFWFKERFFVTCAHFLNELPKHASSKEDILAALKGAGTRVDSSMNSADAGMKQPPLVSQQPNRALADEDSKLVRLLEARFQDDLMIFQLFEGESNPQHYVRDDQLHSVTDDPHSTSTVFTTAYNGQDEAMDETALPDSDKKSTLGAKHSRSVFAYLHALYEEKMGKENYNGWKTLPDQNVSRTRIEMNTLTKPCKSSRTL